MVEKVPLMDSNAFFTLAIENSVGRARGGSSSKLKEGQPEKKAPKGR